MTSENELFNFETTVSNLKSMLEWGSAPLDTEKYNKVHWELKEGEIQAIASAGGATISYCTFRKPFIRDSEITDEYEDDGIEAILNVPQMENYIDFVGGDTIELTFFSDGGKRSSQLRMDGDLSANIFLDKSEADYGNVQKGIVDLYNEDNVFLKSSDNQPLPVNFTTRSREIERIVDVVDFDSFALVNYPVVVEDGELLLDASDKNERDSIKGTLHSENVDGPDASSQYSRGFSELFKNIEGNIDVSFGEDLPLSVVRESNDEALVCRYLLLPSV